MRAVLLAVGLLYGSINLSAADVVKVDYDGFTVWVDCDRRGPVLFHYIAVADTGTFPRHSDYEVDRSVPARCQSLTTDTFQSVITEPGLFYYVGHQAPANHFDSPNQSLDQPAPSDRFDEPRGMAGNRGADRVLARRGPGRGLGRADLGEQL